jgi:glycosyltransferase involved in cell wall biosynthesis
VKILVVYYGHPWPANKDGNARPIFNLLAESKEKFGASVDLICMDKQLDEIPAEMRDNCNKILVSHPPSALFCKLNLIVRYKDAITIPYEEYDIVIFASLKLTEMFIGRPQNKKAVLIAGDKESRRFLQQSLSIRNGVGAIISLLREKTFKEWGKVILYNESEIGPSDRNCVAVPLGVERSNYHNKYQDFAYDIIFTGNMNFEPNQKAVRFILESICPSFYLLHRKHLTVCIAGIGSEQFRRHGSIHIKIQGYVESIEEEIARARLYVSPLFIGSGMKNKVLQAVSTGTPVLGTSISFEGIQCDFADCTEDSPDPLVWARRIASLLLTYQDMITTARKNKVTVENSYSWEQFARSCLSAASTETSR